VIRGTEAGATFDRGSDELTLHESTAFDDDHHHFSDAEIETRESDSHAAEQVAFLDAVAAGEAPDINTIDEALCRSSASSTRSTGPRSAGGRPAGLIDSRRPRFGRPPAIRTYSVLRSLLRANS